MFQVTYNWKHWVVGNPFYFIQVCTNKNNLLIYFFLYFPLWWRQIVTFWCLPPMNSLSNISETKCSSSFSKFRQRILLLSVHPWNGGTLRVGRQTNLMVLPLRSDPNVHFYWNGVFWATNSSHLIEEQFTSKTITIILFESQVWDISNCPLK